MPCALFLFLQPRRKCYARCSGCGKWASISIGFSPPLGAVIITMNSSPSSCVGYPPPPPSLLPPLSLSTAATPIESSSELDLCLLAMTMQSTRSVVVVPMRSHRASFSACPSSRPSSVERLKTVTFAALPPFVSRFQCRGLGFVALKCGHPFPLHVALITRRSCLRRVLLSCQDFAGILSG